MPGQQNPTGTSFTDGSLGTGARVILLAIVALALLLRAIGLDAWWLNPDEGIYYDVLTAPTWEAFWEGVRWNAHPPLFYLMLRGLGALTWDFYWYRVGSVVAGCAAAAALFLCAYELAGRGRRGTVAGTLCGLLIATSPWAVVASQIMRPYMLLLGLEALALYFLLRHLRERTIWTLLSFVACLCLALLTHYGALLAGAVLGALVARDVASRGPRDPGTLRLLAAGAVPGALAVALYVTHLRPLTVSSLAANALGGWLEPFLRDTPTGLWSSLLGFHAMLVGPRLAVPLALLLLGALAWAAWSRSWDLLALGGGALLLAGALAAMGLYPLGGSRHALWLTPFVLLPVACFVVAALGGDAPGRAFLLGSIALLLATGGALGRALGADGVVPPQEERTLRRDDLGRILDAIASVPGSPPIVMSGQTHYMLLPLFEAERRVARQPDDGSFVRFEWAGRPVVASSSWDLRVRPAELRAANHLLALIQSVDRAWPDLGLADRREALVVFGGWPPEASTGDLQALLSFDGVVSGRWTVPGLQVFLTDLAAYRSVIAAEAGGGGG